MSEQAYTSERLVVCFVPKAKMKQHSLLKTNAKIKNENNGVNPSTLHDKHLCWERLELALLFQVWLPILTCLLLLLLFVRLQHVDARRSSRRSGRVHVEVGVHGALAVGRAVELLDDVRQVCVGVRS